MAFVWSPIYNKVIDDRLSYDINGNPIDFSIRPTIPPPPSSTAPSQPEPINIVVPPPTGGTSSSLDQLLAQIKAENDRILQLRQQEKAASDAALAEQNKIREEARAKALAAIPGLQTQLGNDLLAQQQQAFSRLQPQVEARLNALGLLQSGALPEAQARIQGDLESQRQARIADFAVAARGNLELQQPIINAGQSAQGVSDDLLRNIDLGRTAIQRQFALSDIFRQEEEARRQAAIALEEARRARRERSPIAGSRGQNTITTFGPTFDFTPGGNMHSAINNSFDQSLPRFLLNP